MAAGLELEPSEKDAQAPRLAEVAERLVFTGAKGDEATQRRFHALMADAGREARQLPRERHDGSARLGSRSATA